jgi:hypothetical protein
VRGFLERFHAHIRSSVAPQRAHMSPACPPVLGWPQAASEPCTHGGSCVSLTTCSCVNGWTGSGDFVLNAPTCDISLTYVTVAWSITATVNLAVLLWGLYFIAVVFWLRPLSQNSRSRKRKALFVLTCTCNTLCIFLVAVVRASSPTNTAIGTFAPTTVLFALGSTMFWLSALQFVYLFLQVAVSQARMKANARVSLEAMLRSLNIGLPILGVFAVLANMCVVGMMGATTQSTMYALGLVHYTILALCMVVLGAWLIPKFVNPLVADLEESAQSSQSGGGARSPNHQSKNHDQTAKVRSVLAKLKRFRVELRNNNLVNLPLSLAVGCWPWLQSQSSYFLPIPYITTALLTALALYVEFPVYSVKTSEGAAGRGNNNTPQPNISSNGDANFSGDGGGGGPTPLQSGVSRSHNVTDSVVVVSEA